MSYKTARIALSLVALQVGCAASVTNPDAPRSPLRTEAPKGPFDEYAHRGVLMLALAEPSEGAESDVREASFRALSETPDEREKVTTVFQMQMSIAERIAESATPFFLFVNSTSIRRAIYARCSDHPNVCDALRQGHARIVEMEYDGPWIRDYGPQFVVHGPNEITVNDASYHDVRWQQQIDDRIAAIDDSRLSTVRRRQFDIAIQTNSDDDEDSSEEAWEPRGEDSSRAEPASSSGQRRPKKRRPGVSTAASAARAQELEAARKARTEAAARRRRDAAERLRRSREREQQAVSEKLMLLQHERDALSNLKLRERILDDRSPYHVADAVLASPGFKLEHPPIDLDGGNIMHLHDGRCVTTGTLIERNQGHDSPVEQTLAKYYGCEQTIFLRPLPGGVIEHIDMFLLRAGNKLLLADYNPEIPELHEHIKDLSDGMRTLVIEAATAMDENDRRLRAMNYDVIRVPSPLPIGTEGRVYYPTILNGLAWIAPNNQSHLILPSYASYEEDIQRAGMDVIRKAFEGTRVTQVEARAAAKLQGAVHCLSLVAPYDSSWFYDQKRTGDYARTSAGILNLKKKEIAKILEGSWREVRGPVRFIVSDTSIKFIVAGRTEATWKIETMDVGRGNEDVRLDLSDDDSKQSLSIDCRDSDRLTIKMAIPGAKRDRVYVVRRDKE